VDIYSKAFNKILNAKSHIYIDALIVSEFINRYARMKGELILPGVSFKRFRQSPEFQAVASDIVADVKRVLQHCTQVECDFETLAMDDLLDEFKTGNFDFNDQVLTALCKRRNLKLVTDDGDFDTAEISVLTANRTLLR
jgi:predicted nucleic acid-binding protein